MVVGRAARLARGCRPAVGRAFPNNARTSALAVRARQLVTKSESANAAGTAAAAIKPDHAFAYPTPAGSVSSASAAADDLNLRPAFDQPVPSTYYSQIRPTGLFLHDILTSPSSLPDLTTRTLIHATHIVKRISTAPNDPSGKELRLVVKNLDRLSDLLCGVIDMCELIRNVHPDTNWVMEADRSYERLCSFMNGLNTDRGLFEVSVMFPA